MINGKDKTFARITNQDILDELKGLRQDFTGFKSVNEAEHNVIAEKNQVNKAKIEMVKYIATAALGISLFIATNLLLKVI